MNIVPSWQHRQIFDRWYNKKIMLLASYYTFCLIFKKVCHALKKTAKIGISALLSDVVVF